LVIDVTPIYLTPSISNIYQQEHLRMRTKRSLLRRLLIFFMMLCFLGAQTAQQVYTDQNGIFKFNADLNLDYTSNLTNIGNAVATWTDFAAVSAFHKVSIYNQVRPCGIVFLFSKNSAPSSVTDTWLDSGLRLGSGVPDDSYGSCISLNHNLVVVGAPADSGNGQKNGAGGATVQLANVYNAATNESLFLILFVYLLLFVPLIAYVHFGTNLDTTTTLRPDVDEGDADTGVHFGSSVAITVPSNLGSDEGTLVLVGAYGHGRNDRTNTG
jgi:hypothetical protein